MASTGVTVPDLRAALQSANLGMPVGELLVGQPRGRRRVRPLPQGCARRRANWWSACADGKPVFLQDVATVRDGPLPASRYVWHGGRAGASAAAGEFPAVTIAITKKPGENAIDVADAVMRARADAAQHRHPARHRGRGNPQLRRDRQRQGAAS